MRTASFTSLTLGELRMAAARCAGHGQQADAY
jgi:hypothetical protein